MTAARLFGRCGLCGKLHLDVMDAAPATASLLAFTAAFDNDMLVALHQTRGKMFAAAHAVDDDGQVHELRAFSGDILARNDWPGFVPPLLERCRTHALEQETLAAIGLLDREMRGADATRLATLKRQRRQLSATLMIAMHDVATLCTAGGREVGLRESFASITGQRGIPSGTGDCCLPKLLHHANRRRWRTVSVAEMWWGPPQGIRLHGQMQEPCAEKCQPIMGALLCPH
jgi:hypothetical protein